MNSPSGSRINTRVYYLIRVWTYFHRLIEKIKTDKLIKEIIDKELFNKEEGDRGLDEIIRQKE